MKNNIYNIWQNRWKNAEKKECISFLGKLMFKYKIKVMDNILSNLNIKDVIEIGCGLGYTASVFNRKNNYFGIDISEDAINFCIKKGLNVKLEKLEDVNLKYDLVFSDGMLEHFLNFEPYVKKMTEISNNYVMLIQPNHESFIGKTLVYLSSIFKGEKNVFEYNYKISDFIDVFEKYDFLIEKNKAIFLNVFKILLFKKKS